jgi:hypothetical protein
MMAILSSVLQLHDDGHTTTQCGRERDRTASFLDEKLT